ncbi:hypothetical protein DL771_003900 [Monosporascus sp. 5C6A]|nr:hypothetical protein DL771_003900 [Monosporascus sp. 5C6A]
MSSNQSSGREPNNPFSRRESTSSGQTCSTKRPPPGAGIRISPSMYRIMTRTKIAVPAAADMGEPEAREAGVPEAQEAGVPETPEAGHYSRKCVGPVVPMGYLKGTCVECEEAGHNKPEAQSDTNLADLLKKRLGARNAFWLDARNFYLPWTGLFAWNYQREQEEVRGPGYWKAYKYSFVGRPDLEAPKRPSDPKRGLCADAREAIQKLRDTGYSAKPAGPSVDASRSSSRRRAANSGAGPRSRSRSVTSEYDAEPDGCTNCGEPGHRSSLCPQACRACGSSEHKYKFCPDMLDACICRAYPRHLLEQCEVPCELCGDNIPAHRAVECAVRCQYCGKIGHSTLQKCQSHSRMYKGEHCSICGYADELDIQREQHGGPVHTCQWRKGTDPMRPGAGVHLQYLKCGHKIASSRDLADVRLTAVARHTSHAKDWEAAKAQGREGGEDPWYDELPECPTYFKAKYPGGDYKLQTKDADEMPVDYE